MPYFEIEGKGIDSGRKRKARTYFAKNEEAAIKMAKKDGTHPDRVELLEIMHFVTTVAGCSHKNADNTSRQKIVKKCKKLEKLELVHEIGNRHDKHATKIMRSNGQQVGYLPQHIAHNIIEGYWKDSGCLCTAFNLGLEKLDPDSSIFTLRILVFVAFPSVPQEDISEYANSILSELSVNMPINSIIPMKSLKSIEISRQKKESSGCLGIVLLFLIICFSFLMSAFKW